MIGAFTGYLMEDPREAQRLASKVDASGWVQRYLTRAVGSADRVLEVGCGPAAIVAEAAKQFPTLQITGLESLKPKTRSKQIKFQAAFCC